jgi:hypothetical protein
VIFLLHIEEDAHFRGGPPPKPWVAEITGLHHRFGLARNFVRALRDYRNAHVAWSGNVYGVVATFPLWEGKLYEVAWCKGRSSKRRFVREFFLVEGGKMVERTPEEALSYATEIHAPRYPQQHPVRA